MNASAKAAGYAIGGIFASGTAEEKAQRLMKLILSQTELLTREFGQLKGSLMKVGQMLSMYGENILPPEANAILKSLQNDSPPLEWEAIEKELMKELGPEKLAALEIERESFASASLGQVHRAVRKSDGLRLAIKVQYPGVDRAIDSDLGAMKRLLSITKLIPSGEGMEKLFYEVREMLHREVDYVEEQRTTERFRSKLESDGRYVVPGTVPEFCTARVLTTTYEEGVAVDGPEVAALSQERRDALARSVLELFFRELFEWREMQTDPHFGNYRVRLSADGKDRLVLLDFGAVRKFGDEFIAAYTEMVRGAYRRDVEHVARGASMLGFIRAEDNPELRRAFAELCFMIMEPFGATAYDWGASDLPRRAIPAGKRLAFQFGLRPPPREVVFLDRKLGGVFIFLSVLRSRIAGGPVIERYLG